MSDVIVDLVYGDELDRERSRTLKTRMKSKGDHARKVIEDDAIDFWTKVREVGMTFGKETGDA